jgi:hypothetical protein
VSHIKGRKYAEVLENRGLKKQIGPKNQEVTETEENCTMRA